MTSDITIQPVDAADAVLLDLQGRCFLPTEVVSPRVGFWWLALDEDGGAVGFGGMRPVKTWPGCWYLCRAGVLPEFRGRGIQRRLIRARVAKARWMNASHVISDCTTRNYVSARNLIACGFRPYWPEEPWGLDESIYWMREL